MSHDDWNSVNRYRRGRSRTRGENPRSRRTSTPNPNNEISSSSRFGDELTEFTYHVWLKALQREDGRQGRYARPKTRRNPANSATSTSSYATNPDFPVTNPHIREMFVPHLPVSRQYILSHTYRPSENPARLVFIRPSPLYLPPPNTELYCCPLLGYYENGTVGVIPYAFYCFYM